MLLTAICAPYVFTFVDSFGKCLFGNKPWPTVKIFTIVRRRTRCDTRRKNALLLCLGLLHRNVAQFWHRHLRFPHPTEIRCRTKFTHHECRVSCTCFFKTLPDQIEFIDRTTQSSISHGFLRVRHAMLVRGHRARLELSQERWTYGGSNYSVVALHAIEHRCRTTVESTPTAG